MLPIQQVITRIRLQNIHIRIRIRLLHEHTTLLRQPTFGHRIRGPGAEIQLLVLFEIAAESIGHDLAVLGKAVLGNRVDAAESDVVGGVIFPKAIGLRPGGYLELLTVGRRRRFGSVDGHFAASITADDVALRVGEREEGESEKCGEGYEDGWGKHRGGMAVEVEVVPLKL